MTDRYLLFQTMDGLSVPNAADFSILTRKGEAAGKEESEMSTVSTTPFK